MFESDRKELWTYQLVHEVDTSVWQYLEYLRKRNEFRSRENEHPNKHFVNSSVEWQSAPAVRTVTISAAMREREMRDTEGETVAT